MNAIDWEKQFPIASINKADLTEFGYTDEQIAALFTDEIMEEIAANMEESYHMNFGFWEDFKRAIQVVLKYSLELTKIHFSTGGLRKSPFFFLYSYTYPLHSLCR